MKKILISILLLFTLNSCINEAYSIPEVKSGEIKHLPYSDNAIFGTDSTIVIFNRTSGFVLSVIHRKTGSSFNNYDL